MIRNKSGGELFAARPTIVVVSKSFEGWALPLSPMFVNNLSEHYALTINRWAIGLRAKMTQGLRRCARFGIDLARPEVAGLAHPCWENARTTIIRDFARNRSVLVGHPLPRRWSADEAENGDQSKHGFDSQIAGLSDRTAVLRWRSSPRLLLIRPFFLKVSDSIRVFWSSRCGYVPNFLAQISKAGVRVSQKRLERTSKPNACSSAT
jgi:hypothetical protein